VQKAGFSFRATRASALCACACAAALCLVDLKLACGLRLCRFAYPLPLGLRLLALLAAGGATRLGGVFVLVGSFFLCLEVSPPLPPRPFPAVLESVFILLLARWVVHFVAVLSHFPRAQKILVFYLFLSLGLGVGREVGCFRGFLTFVIFIFTAAVYETPFFASFPPALLFAGRNSGRCRAHVNSQRGG
jgi:hypothetical protein